jgi:hypothetical protein
VCISFSISNLQHIYFCVTFSVFILFPYAWTVSAFAGIVVTNDGNAILREIDIAHPAAKVRQMLLFRICYFLFL